MSMTHDASPNAGAAERPEMPAVGIGLPYHRPELREYGTLQELTLAGGGAETLDGPSSYGTNPTPAVS